MNSAGVNIKKTYYYNQKPGISGMCVAIITGKIINNYEGINLYLHKWHA